MSKEIKLQEKAIDEIIKRYGEVIDLKKSPYVIIEIMRQYQNLANDLITAECLPPGGPPASPGDGGGDGGDIRNLLNGILRELSTLSSAVRQLTDR